MKRYLLFLTLFLVNILVWKKAYSQNISELKTNAVVPNYKIPKVENYPIKSINFSDLRGKLVIFDFWYTRCVSCIEGFAKMEALQKEFGNQIQIFLVNKQSRDLIQQEFGSMNKKLVNLIQSTSLPFITGDTLLSSLFPHTIVPHIVWIDVKGRVKGITSSKYITSENIRAILNNDFVRLPLKRDLINFDTSLAMFPQLYESMSAGEREKYYTIIRQGSLNVAASVNADNSLDTINKTMRLTRYNSRVIDLYFGAFHEFKFKVAANVFKAPELDYGKRMVLEVKDSSKYVYQASSGQFYEEWAALHTYCYESVVKLEKADRQYEWSRMCKKLIEDLNSHFNIHGRMEKRQTMCYVLRRDSVGDPLSTAGGDHKFEETEKGWLIQNQPFKRFLDQLNFHLDLPLIDESRIDYNIDLLINLNKKSDEILKDLYKNNLRLEKELRTIDMMVVTEMEAN